MQINPNLFAGQPVYPTRADIADRRTAEPKAKVPETLPTTPVPPVDFQNMSEVVEETNQTQTGLRRLWALA